jgi:outer membrane protein OmpA-like peptidoglycan-associated protein
LNIYRAHALLPYTFMHQTTLTRLTLAAALAATVFTTGCADMSETQKGTAKGAAIGTVAGAIIGTATGGKNTVAGAVLGGAIGAVAGNVWSKKMEAQKQAMEQATQGTGVDVVRTPDNQLKLNIPNDISFATGSAALKPELREVLQQFAKGLSENPGTLVKVIGHTDNVGTDATNQHLSVERADTVRDFLDDRGVAKGRIETAGRGEREPMASNDTVEGRAKNRRVEIFLREPEQAAAQPAAR